MNTNLYTALLEAQRSLTSVHKDAKNDWGKYGYTSAEEMISQCRKALIDSGLCLARTNWSLAESKVHSHFCLTHAESGEHLEFGNEMLVVSSKNPDKSVLAALTTSLNYALRDLLLIPRVDEKQPEIDNRPPQAERELAAAQETREEFWDAVTPAPKWMSNAFGLVLGMKDNPSGYTSRILRAATDKYGQEFTEVSSLPEEYLLKVFDHHGFKVSIEDRKVGKDS